MPEILTFVAMWAAPFLSLVLMAPTAWRPIADRGVGGISVTYAVACTLTIQLWLTYSILIADPRQMVVNAFGITVRVGIMLAALWACRRNDIRIATAVAVVLLAGVSLAGATVVGVLATSMAVVNRLPQVSFTVRNGAGAGLSVVGVGIAALADLAWVGYGVASADWIVIGSSSIATVFDTAILLAATRPEHAAVARMRAMLTPPVGPTPEFGAIRVVAGD